MDKIKDYFSIVALLLTGTVFYHFAEEFRWIDALYFSVIALTTAGFGDITPQTDLGKIFTMLYILSGFGIMVNFLNSSYERRWQKYQDTRGNKDHNNEDYV